MDGNGRVIIKRVCPREERASPIKHCISKRLLLQGTVGGDIWPKKNIFYVLVIMKLGKILNHSMVMKQVEYVLFTYRTMVFIIYGCMFNIPQLNVHKPSLDDVYPLTVEWPGYNHVFQFDIYFYSQILFFSVFFILNQISGGSASLMYGGMAMKEILNFESWLLTRWRWTPDPRWMSSVTSFPLRCTAWINNQINFPDISNQVNSSRPRFREMDIQEYLMFASAC